MTCVTVCYALPDELDLPAYLRCASSLPLVVAAGALRLPLSVLEHATASGQLPEPVWFWYELNAGEQKLRFRLAFLAALAATGAVIEVEDEEARAQ